MTKLVRKRDGKIQTWDRKKIESAMFSAFNELRPNDIPNITQLAKQVEDQIKSMDLKKEYDIEVIQDTVEQVLMDKHPEVAQVYIRYRASRDKIRDERLIPDKDALSQYIHAAKYADDGGRETYEGTATRNERMHLNHYKEQIKEHPELKEAITNAYNAVHNKEVLPSMRSMQFGGDPIEKNNCRLYNCAFTHINRLRVFGEIFYVLLSGCGVGYSVQFHHVEQLPEVLAIDESKVRHVVLEDNIEGWADGINELIRSYFVTGDYVEFAFHKIRPEGAKISSGGLAPGHLPLKRCLEKVRAALRKAAGRKLRPIEVHDIICYIADAVLAGGIRRSALIALFSADDSEMMYAKADENFRPAFGSDPGVNSQRQLANNSAVLVRGNVRREVFDRLMKIAQQWGEPGFYFTDDTEFGCNPCGEIGMWPVLRNYSTLKRKGDRIVDTSLDFKPLDKPFDGTNTEAIKAYGHDTGFQFCNLTEGNNARVTSPEHLVEVCKHAAVIGTVQAGYTDFPYLGPVTEKITRREALLGVSLTGIMDNPEIGLNPIALKMAAEAAVKENERIAKMLGIKAAARVTTIKPSGTASLELGGIGAGIHYHHARRYFRRVTANPNESVAKHFMSVNPHMVEEKPNGDVCLVFPTQAPDDAKTVKEEPADEFVEHILTVYECWVKPGSATRRNRLPLTHNVSSTTALRDGEWDEVVDMVWDNSDRITAMSFLPIISDKMYPFAPREEVVTESDEAQWNYLISNYKPVSYEDMEDPSERSLSLEPACAGGVCEI